MNESNKRFAFQGTHMAENVREKLQKNRKANPTPLEQKRDELKVSLVKQMHEIGRFDIWDNDNDLRKAKKE